MTDVFFLSENLVIYMQQPLCEIPFQGEPWGESRCHDECATVLKEAFQVVHFKPIGKAVLGERYALSTPMGIANRDTVVALKNFLYFKLCFLFFI